MTRQESRALFGAGKPETKGWFQQQTGRIMKAPVPRPPPPAYGTKSPKALDTVTISSVHNRFKLRILDIFLLMLSFGLNIELL